MFFTNVKDAMNAPVRRREVLAFVTFATAGALWLGPMLREQGINVPPILDSVLSGVIGVAIVEGAIWLLTRDGSQRIELPRGLDAEKVQKIVTQLQAEADKADKKAKSA